MQISTAQIGDTLYSKSHFITLQKDIQGLDFFIDQEGSTAYTRL
jgi:hypothetical protein